MQDLNIAVLGAGVIGITTAVELQKQFRNAKINVIADKFGEDTTSAVAAGIFRPGTGFMGPSKDITQKWVNDSYYYWDDIRRSVEGPNAGVAEISGYLFSSEFKEIVKNHYLEKLLPIYRRTTEEELKLCKGDWKYGTFFTTVVTQNSYYLPWSTKKFLAAGGNILEKKVNYFSDVANDYNVVVNCTGLGAKALCSDNQLVPIRGQVIKVKAPWIKTFFYGNYDTYILPGLDSVTLGGTRQYESYDKSVNKYDGLSIKERCEEFVPSLRGAEVIAHKVGLRPHRTPVRVEKEVLNLNGNKVNIVHNYGHGGYGVTTAPGTSLYAVGLVKEMLMGNCKL
ncbi:unnamed protein product [Brassicogethes aeneus]|uniref:FAD dependent oxidoreductase domain-containing protein n=1 Tax=Brassicogethes aeneus TaxID=1431903 RepID=A0A9P0ATC7_BRAAE|nr:unnamed protein product [Brassicogethes aeneus]